MLRVFVYMIKVGSNIHSLATPNMSRAAHRAIKNQPQLWLLKRSYCDDDR